MMMMMMTACDDKGRNDRQSRKTSQSHEKPTIRIGDDG